MVGQTFAPYNSRCYSVASILAVCRVYRTVAKKHVQTLFTVAYDNYGVYFKVLFVQTVTPNIRCRLFSCKIRSYSTGINGVSSIGF